MRTRLLLACFAAAALCLPARALGQGSCRWEEREGSNLQMQNQGLPTETAIMTRPDLRCENGRRIIADQGTWSRAGNRFEFFGNVDVSDPDRRLTADRVTFLTQARQFNAVGRAVLVDRTTGSVIRGDIVNFQEKTPQREARIEAVATSAVAQAVLVRDSERSPGTRDTTTVDAQQITIIGEESFRAIGNAVMRRDSLTVTGFAIDYAQAANAMEVAGGGRVALPRYTLIGDSISARISADDEIESVLGRHGTQLQSEDMNVRAGAIRIAFVDGGIDRMTAMNWPPIPGAQLPPRPRVEAREFNLESDSIDVLAPGQQITEAVAIGNAYGERITPDSMRALLPETRPDVGSLIANDWMRGDTVRAFFAANPDTAGRPDAAERVMERLHASGTPARSMYRVRDEGATRLSINYLVATEIEVTFAGGSASLLRAAGDAKGVYLQPEEAARRARAGGTRAPQ